jgi:hypothetical protein
MADGTVRLQLVVELHGAEGGGLDSRLVYRVDACVRVRGYSGDVTQTVWHAGYRIVINLSLEDLGHPNRPSLWDEIYKPDPSQPRHLRCMALDDDDGTECPEAMYVQVRDSLRSASHLRRDAKPHRNEGPKHKVLKERIAAVAQRAGFDVEVEDVSTDRSRRTDVLVDGGDGGPIGWEIQFSHISGPAVITTAPRSPHPRRCAQHRRPTTRWLTAAERDELVDSTVSSGLQTLA